MRSREKGERGIILIIQKTCFVESFMLQAFVAPTTANIIR